MLLCLTPFLTPRMQAANGASLPEQLRRRQAFVESLTSGVMAALLIGLACTLFLRSAPFQYMMAGLRSAFASGAAGAALARCLTRDASASLRCFLQAKRAGRPA